MLCVSTVIMYVKWHCLHILAAVTHRNSTFTRSVFRTQIISIDGSVYSTGWSTWINCISKESQLCLRIEISYVQWCVKEVFYHYKSEFECYNWWKECAVIFRDSNNKRKLYTISILKLTLKRCENNHPFVLYGTAQEARLYNIHVHVIYPMHANDHYFIYQWAIIQ